MALKKQCKCGLLIDYSQKYCAECQKKYGDNGRKKYYQEYDKQRKDDKYYKFYQSKEWKRLRDYVLKHYKYIDLYEYYINKKIVMANTAHHVEEIRDCWGKRLEFDNMFPCSDTTHNVIHGLYKKDKARTQKLLIEIISSSQTVVGG